MNDVASKAVFVDVDGTLINHLGLIPESAREAVQEARANGHRVFLATGRAMAELWDELHEIGFDGVITGAGAHVEVRGEVLTSTNMTPDQVTRVVDYFEAHGVEYVLESHHGVIGSPGAADALREGFGSALTDEELLAQAEGGYNGFLEMMQVGADPLSMPIHKVCFFSAPVSLDQITSAFDGEFVIVPSSIEAFGPNSGELAPAGIHKAIGLDLICAHLGIDRADTVAIGDGMNDLEMLAHAGIGIAMGGAPQAVRDAADAVTGTPDEHGIRDAFLRFSLIEAASAPA